MSHDLDNKRAWQQCLRVEGVKLPTGYFFGLTATTGDLSDAHDVISVKAYQLDATEDQMKEDRTNIEPSSSYFESPRLN